MEPREDKYIPLNIKDGISVSDEEALWLYEKSRTMTSIVELGSFQGKSTHALLTGCSGKVFAVDHFKGSSDPNDQTYHKNGKKVFLDNVGRLTNLVLLEMRSEEASNQFGDKSVDMVFIDAGHLYWEILVDIKLWLPKTKTLICGHDFVLPGVGRAVTEMFGEIYKRPLPNIWEVNL